MAPLAIALVERRRDRRRPAGGRDWPLHAVLRPGVSVTLLNISCRAALVESGARLRPGAQTEMQLGSGGGRASIRGRLDRCYVAGLEPLRYRGVLLFDRQVEIQDDEMGSG